MITSPKSCVNIPKRFAGLGTIPMQDPDLAAGELERCIRELGLRGAQIGTHVDANPHSGRIDPLNLDNASLQPVWSAAEQLGAAIFVHPWDMLGKKRMPKYWLPWLVGMPAETSLAICSMIFGGVFDRFPKLRVAFAHGGGAFPFTVGRIEHAFHVRPDLVAVENNTNPRAILLTAPRPPGSTSIRSCTTPTRCDCCSSFLAPNASRSDPIIPFR